MENRETFFSSKVVDNERITLIEGDKVISENREVIETFKLYYETTVEDLSINSKFMSEESVSNKSVNDIIGKFQYHPSIIKIKENQQRHFSFSTIEVEDVDRKTDLLDAFNAIQ